MSTTNLLGGIKRGRLVRLTNSASSVSRLSRKCEVLEHLTDLLASTASYRDSFTLPTFTNLAHNADWCLESKVGTFLDVNFFLSFDDPISNGTTQSITNDKCIAVAGMKIGKGNRHIRKKPAQMPPCPLKFTHGLG
jgi:hypothetical protein